MKLSSVAFAVACLLAAIGRAADAPRPNIFVIMTDDQARWSVGAYGNKESKTPNMDRLAREGALFTNAFVTTPVCSPSRACFFSGMQGTQVGVTDWISPKENEDGIGLRKDAMTWPQVLKANGYATGLIGKWHIGDKPDYHPQARGFDYFMGFLQGGDKPFDPTLDVNGKRQVVKGNTANIFMDDAISYITKNADKPFAACIMFREPHLPYAPTLPEDSEPFKDLDPTIPDVPAADMQVFKRWTRNYYASIYSVDRNIGKLLAKLDELKIADRTMILFTSDHGYMIGQHRLHAKGNASWIGSGTQGPMRPNMFEYAIRVPLIVRWPGVVKPGTKIEQIVANVDTFATMCGVAGIPKPADVKTQGIDFSPLLRGQDMKTRDELYGQYDLHNASLAFMRMVRTPEWKLIRHYYSNGEDEMYNLKDDPEELKNVYWAPEARAARDELQKKLTAWMESIDDPLLKGLPPVK